MKTKQKMLTKPITAGFASIFYFKSVKDGIIAFTDFLVKAKFESAGNFPVQSFQSSDSVGRGTASCFLCPSLFSAVRPRS